MSRARSLIVFSGVAGGVGGERRDERTAPRPAPLVSAAPLLAPPAPRPLRAWRPPVPAAPRRPPREAPRTPTYAHFRELSRLGKGGFGAVYRVLGEDGAEYAVKKVQGRLRDVLPDVPERLDPTLVQKLFHEAAVMTELQHANVLPCHRAWIELEWEESPRPPSPWWGADDASAAACASDSDTAAVSATPAPAPSAEESAPEPWAAQWAPPAPRPATPCELSATSATAGTCADLSTEKRSVSCSCSGTCVPCSTCSACACSCSGSYPSSSSDSNSRSRSRLRTPPATPRGRFTCYIQMPLCEEQSLHEWLRAHPERAAVDVRTLFAQVLAGVQYIHAQGWVHRDLKPANILLRSGLRVCIADFGLARRRGTSARGGTPLYAAPEQLAGAPCDDRADVWALGLLLAEVHVPFRTDMERVATLKALRRRPSSPLPRALAAPLLALLADMLALVPTARPDVDSVATRYATTAS